MSGSDTLALLAPAILGESGESTVMSKGEKGGEGGAKVEPEEEAEFDPEHMDNEGRMLWFGELQVLMDPHSKQYVQVCTDLTDDIKAGWRKKVSFKTLHVSVSFVVPIPTSPINLDHPNNCPSTAVP